MMKKFIKIMSRMVIENIDFNKLSKDDLESLLIISTTTPGSFGKFQESGWGASSTSLV